MKTNLRSTIYDLRLALATLAALAILLVAWLVPLPGLMLGVEAQAAGRMPETRAAVQQAQSKFEQAETSYKTYVTTHDVGAALDTLEGTTARLETSPTPQQMEFALTTAAQPVLDYIAQLQAYAVAGEAYFSATKHYDDELMAWTRSLGAESESLRPDTWPIVEYLKLYPPPTGEKADYASVTPADVSDLRGKLDPATVKLDTAETLSQYQSFIARLREAGRSIEYTESLQAQYRTLLDNYYAKLEGVASGANSANLSGRRTLFALATNLLLGLAVVGGLVALFVPRLRTGKKEGAA